MSQERLEEIETKYSTLTVSSEKNSTEYTEVDVEDLVFLIQNGFKQAELVGYFARKNGELNEFLNKYIEPKHLGENVIDVAMDIIVKQAERVQELEELIAAYHTELSIKDNANKRIKKKNKRYKQALERILENWKTSNGAISGETIAFNSKEIARQALEVGNNE